MNEKDAILERRCTSNRTGRTHLSLGGQATRIFSSHQRSLLCGGSSGEIATNASVQQYRDAGVPRNSQQQLPMSHHLTTVIISSDFSTRPTLHNLYICAARFSSIQSLFFPLCPMSSWKSPMHFRVHARLQDSVSAAHLSIKGR